MRAPHYLTAIHVVSCVLACGLGEVLTGGAAGLNQLAASRWCFAALVTFLVAILLIGVLGVRAIAGHRQSWAVMVAAATAPAVVGVTGGALALVRTPHAPGLEGASLLSIEVAMSALWYGLTWSAAALLVTRIGVACAARAAVIRTGVGPLRGQVMSSGRRVGALLGPLLASLSLFWAAIERLPNTSYPVWQGHLINAVWGEVLGVGIAIATAVPVAGDLQLLSRTPEGVTQRGVVVAPASIGLAVLALQTAIAAWAFRPFERGEIPMSPALVLVGVVAAAALFVGECAPVWRSRRVVAAAGRVPSMACVGLALAGASAVLAGGLHLLDTVNWSNAPNFPAIVTVRGTRVEAIEPGHLEVVVDLEVENLLDKAVQVNGAQGWCEVLGNDTDQTIVPWTAALAAHSKRTFPFRASIVREDMILPRPPDGALTAKGDVYLTDGAQRGTVPFVARGALADSDRRTLFALPRKATQEP